MHTREEDAGTAHRRSRRTLWLILAVCAAPLLGSYVAYYFWRPSSQVNYGVLLEPRPLPDVELRDLNGNPFRLSHLKGEWVLLTAGPARCDKRCSDSLVYMRQVRLAQGKDSDRLERVWLLIDAGAPEPTLIAQHPGLHVARDPQKGVVAALPAHAAVTEHIYVIDPLGNLMMRFPANPDPRRVLKDISRLLRHSKWK
jgi:cytochrome oxidase Cu insertion factor (SCO1/SenC/PrrC family)